MAHGAVPARARARGCIILHFWLAKTVCGSASRGNVLYTLAVHVRPDWRCAQSHIEVPCSAGAAPCSAAAAGAGGALSSAGMSPAEPLEATAACAAWAAYAAAAAASAAAASASAGLLSSTCTW